MTVLNLVSGDAEKTNEFGETQGSFREQNLGFLVSYARRLWGKTLDGGLNVKMVRQSFADYTATGYGADAGFLYRPFAGAFSLGLSFQNVMAPSIKLKEKADKFPLIMKAGTSYRFNLFGRTTLLTAESSQGGGSSRLGFGLEQDLLADFPLQMRVGANTQEYTLGFGLGRSLMTFDYAAVLHELEIVHRFGVTMRLRGLGWNAERELEEKWKRVKAKEVELLDKEKDLAEKESQFKRDQKREETPFSIPGWLQQAKELYAAKDYANSLKILDKILATSPKDEKVLELAAMSRAHLLMAKDDFKGAKKALEAAVELNPDNREAVSLYERVKELMEIYEKP
jgi:tetratricopeptide (TPR) repeat protein